MVTRINIRAFGGFELTPGRTDMMNAGQYRNYVTEFLGTTAAAGDYLRTVPAPSPRS